MNREIAVEILSETGVAVDTAENGQIAVNLVKDAPAGTYDPDLYGHADASYGWLYGGRTYPCTEEGGCENAPDHRHDGQRLCGRPAKDKGRGHERAFGKAHRYGSAAAGAGKSGCKDLTCLKHARFRCIFVFWIRFGYKG